MRSSLYNLTVGQYLLPRNVEQYAEKVVEPLQKKLQGS